MDDSVVEVPHQNKMMLPSASFIQQCANRVVVIGAKNITIWSSIAHTYENSISTSATHLHADKSLTLTGIQLFKGTMVLVLPVPYIKEQLPVVPILRSAFYSRIDQWLTYESVHMSEGESMHHTVH